MKEARIIKTITPTPSYRRHSEGDFLRLKDGGIIFVYARFLDKGGKDDDPAELAAMYSYDNGETWTDPETFLRSEQFGPSTIMSVSLMRMLNGDFGLFFEIKTEVHGSPKWEHTMALARSKDEGKTFYSITPCSPAEYEGRYGLNNDRVERLSSGRIIVPISIHAGAYKPDKEGKARSRISRHTINTHTYSDDDGYTWKTSSDLVCPPFTSTTKGLQEGGVVEISPGILKSYFRSDKMYQYTSISFDNGDHWTSPQISCFTSPWSALKVERNPFNGKLYGIWNPVPLYNGRFYRHIDWGRTPYYFAELSDDITSFKNIQVIEDEPDHGYSYVATLFTAEDEILLGYCSGGPEDGTGLCRQTIAKLKIKQPE